MMHLNSVAVEAPYLMVYLRLIVFINVSICFTTSVSASLISSSSKSEDMAAKGWLVALSLLLALNGDATDAGKTSEPL